MAAYLHRYSLDVGLYNVENITLNIGRGKSRGT